MFSSTGENIKPTLMDNEKRSFWDFITYNETEIKEKIENNELDFFITI